MVHYVHINGRQHGVTADTASHEIQLIEDTLIRGISESTQCHGIYYYQARKQPHPFWLQKELVYACAGNRGLKRLDEVWCNTWILSINLKIEGHLNRGRIRALLGLHMKVERMECTERGPNETIKRMRRLRDRIPWLPGELVETGNTNHYRYFGERFEIGRNI